AALLVLGGVAVVYGYRRFAPTRYLLDAKLATLPSGRSVLIVQELIGSSKQNSQSLRFDFLDPASGERLERTNAPLSLGGERLRFLGGGGARQWWGRDGNIVQVDAEQGTV